MKKSKEAEFVTNDPNIDYSDFVTKYNSEPEEYLTQQFSKEELRKLMKLPYIDMDYGSEEKLQNFIDESSKYDIATEIVAEWFDSKILMRAVDEILRKMKK